MLCSVPNRRFPVDLAKARNRGDSVTIQKPNPHSSPHQVTLSQLKMDSVFYMQVPTLSLPRLAATNNHRLPSLCANFRCLFHRSSRVPRFAGGNTLAANSVPQTSGVYSVGDFMTRKEDLHVVKPATPVDQALETLVEHRITGFPVIDDDWNLVGVVSDYDLLALDSISGPARNDNNMFPEADKTWQTFNEIQKLLSKTNGKLIGECSGDFQS